MEHSIVKAQKAGQAGDRLFCSLTWDVELEGADSFVISESKFKRFLRRLRSKHTLLLNAKKLQSRGICFHEPLLQRTRDLQYGIPKHIVTLDEKCLRGCLELINTSALKDIEMGFLSDDLTSPKCRLESLESASDLSRFAVDSAGTGNGDASMAGQWIIGTVTRSPSMINILNSPLFRQYGSLDGNPDSRSMVDVEASLCMDCSVSSTGLTKKLQKDMPLSGHRRHVSEIGRNGFSPSSSMDSSSPDQFSTSDSLFLEGVMERTWKLGIPQYVFSMDNQKEMHLAKLLKVSSLDEYIYLFQKEPESSLVGKMKVSTSFAPCSDNSSIMETEFVLFSTPEDSTRQEQALSYNNLRKSKGFAKKVVKAFRSSKQSSYSEFHRVNTIFENCSWVPRCEVSDDPNSTTSSTNLLDNVLPPHLESAAIVAKEHVLNNNRKVDGGGWGLKFLKKLGAWQTDATVEARSCSECCSEGANGCSSLDVVLPAGFHGGPRKMSGGPSRLVQRWRSGGLCDCGGWDLGCPLTILNAGCDKRESAPQENMQGGRGSFDLFMQGSDQGVPTLKMAAMHDGLYSVHFRSALSPLQAFSIAVAIMHTRNPALRPRNVRELQ